MPDWTFTTATLNVFVLIVALTIVVINGTIRFLLKINSFIQFLRILLLYMPIILSAALLTGIAIYQLRYRARRRRRRKEREEKERAWKERIERVKEESERLRGHEVEYIIDHLMDDVPLGHSGLGIVQARVEAIRRYMVDDPTVIERLRGHLEGATDPEVKRMLWSVIDDMTRIHVIKEEKQLFAGEVRK